MNNKNTSMNFTFLFGKRNYQIMLVGLVLIVLGFVLMTGYDANTRPDGVYDPNYWNDGIFSWRRIRLAPFLVLTGFVVEIYAILLNPDKTSDKANLNKTNSNKK